MVNVCTGTGTHQWEPFFARLGGDMGGLGAPPVTRFGTSTEADLGIFHAHSKPF